MLAKRFFWAFVTASLLLASDATGFDLFVTSGGSVLQLDRDGNATPFVTTAPLGENGFPVAIAFDRDGNLLLSQGFTGQTQNIRKFSPEGEDLGVFGSIGTIDPFLDLIFDAAGNLYASDFSVNELWRFSPTGVPELFAKTGAGPDGLAFDRFGNVFVGLLGAGMIAKYSPEGVLLQSFGLGLLESPMGLAIDKSGLLYVTSGDAEIKRFTPDGKFLDVFASSGLNGPVGMEFDAGGNLYVANSVSGTIRRFSPTGVDLGDFVSGLHILPGSGLNLFRSLRRLPFSALRFLRCSFDDVSARRHGWSCRASTHVSAGTGIEGIESAGNQQGPGKGDEQGHP